MFKVGDIVEITDGSDSTGMLDFKNGKGYEVIGSALGKAVQVADESGRTGWYHCAHFKLKEEAKVEKKECLFKAGQVVWDVRVGKGKVVCVYKDGGYPTVVEVLFENGCTYLYAKDGKLLGTDKLQSLYFSEPKIEAATEPVFEATLEGGMTLAAVDKETYRFYTLVVGEETQEVVESVHSVVFEKELYDFYRLGEKIEFN